MPLLNDSFNAQTSESNDAFASMAKGVRGETQWYQVNWAFLREYKTLYTITACFSFFLLFLFGVVTLVPGNDCFLQQLDDDRCCSCLQVNETRAQGQQLEYFLGLNSVFYGIVMIVNSGFGFYYVIIGVRTENKYQLSCMIVTQVLEVARALFDTWFETNPTLKHRAVARQVLAYSSLVTLVASGVLIPPLYKQFGWSIFRRGGVLKPVRERYKIYQMFRAFNRLDVQSSALLFLVFGLYLQFIWKGGWWIFVCILICDTLASRQLVRYLKREVHAGVYISMAAKSFVIIWWILITAEYISCKDRYINSVRVADKFWQLDPYPSYESVKSVYNGISCLNPFTHHDDRTWELLLMNLVQAVFFRVGSMFYGIRVAARFGGGLKAVFYREMALANSEEDSKIPEGGQAIKFKAKKKKSNNKHGDDGDDALNSSISNNGDGEDADDTELVDQSEMSSPQGNNDSSADTNYRRFEASGFGGGGGRKKKDDKNKKKKQQEEQEAYRRNGSDEEEDAMMSEHGVSRREMQDDLAW
jgi:hypothetical protein